MAKLTEKSRKVFDYIRSMRGQNITHADIADGVDMPVKSVIGAVTALQKKKLVERIPAEMELEDGTHKAIKLIQETEAGKAYDPDAPEEEVTVATA